ncbi:MAG: DUF1549 domain-containing protein [Opitutales bacterium]|nr:DUF1549 domain-containing protein [Opitutales bacterium]
MTKLPVFIVFISSLLLIQNSFGTARDFHSNNGQKINGSVIKYFEDGDVLIKRSKDQQLFRISLDIFTENDQAFVKNNFPPNHDALPTFNRPLAERDLAINAQFIDRIIETKLRSYNQRPGKEISNETFLRRAYLKIIGRIPSLEEAQDFLTKRDRKARGQLIDKLLASEGYNKNWYVYWADILRAKTRVGNQGSDGYPFVRYLKDSIAANKPYNVWVEEMLASKGPMWERGNGAVGYFYRDQGMGLDNMANTVRVFLGTSLECAQCHDHPFDRWTQKQFYEMAAFTHGTGSVNRRNDQLNELNKLARAAMKENEEDRNRIRNAFDYVKDILSPGLDDLGKGQINLPNDYQYDNAKPGEKLEAKTIFGLVVELDENLQEKGSRASYASWLASPDNPRFSTVIANRLWKSAFGIGLIEPVDNMYDDTLPTDPKLMLHLEKLMVALDYDMKEFLRIIYNTKSFQRTAPAREITSKDSKDETLPPEVKWVIAGPNPDFPKRGAAPYFYQGPVLTRMSGEQLWDSLVTLNYPDLDTRINSRTPEDGFDRYVRFSQMSAEDIFEEVMERYNSQNANRNMDMAAKPSTPLNKKCPIKTTRDADPSITAKNEKGETVAFCCNGCKNKFLAALPPRVKQTQMAAMKSAPLNEMCPIKPDRRADPSITAKNAKGETVAFCCNGCKNKFAAAPPAMVSNMAKSMMNGMDKTPTGSMDSSSYKRSGTPTRDANSLRASEVGDPAPRGHIIIQFGGSRRDQIQVSHKEAAVNQVLAMINGYVEKYLVSNKKSHTLRKISEGPTMEEKVNLAFLAILQRKPNTTELRDFKDMINKLDAEDFHKDVVWALLNSHEFMFVQ